MKLPKLVFGDPASIAAVKRLGELATLAKREWYVDFTPPEQVVGVCSFCGSHPGESPDLVRYSNNWAHAECLREMQEIAVRSGAKIHGVILDPEF